MPSTPNLPSWVFALALIGTASAAVLPALAVEPLVAKQTFAIASYTTIGGQSIPNVRVGYETYGALNAAKDNVIVVCHFITGTSHAAGRYAASDPAPGYWDAIIGPGKPLDTNKYFVVSVDTLANPNAKSPTVVTTGPASINPVTNKPYGMSFPVVAARDFIEVQKRLVDALGIRKIHAVIGASAGAAQAVEWASAYPDMVERLISIAGPGIDNPAYSIAMLNLWAMPVLLDPKWNKGDYYGKEEPADGLSKSLKLVTFSSLSVGWGDKLFKTKWKQEGSDPAQAYTNLYAVEDALDKAGSGRARLIDANNWLYTTKAYQLSTSEAKRIKAKALFIGVTSDLIFPPLLSQRAAMQLKAQGNVAEYGELPSDGGHFDGIARADLAGSAIASFLSN